MAPIFSSVSSGGGGRARGFGYGSAGAADRDPKFFRNFTGNINPDSAVSTDGTPAGGFWVAGDVVTAAYSGSTRSINYASYAGNVRVHVIGGGGGTQGDRGGWCSNSGGGGGGGAYRSISNPSNASFYVGNGGARHPNSGGEGGRAPNGQNTWYSNSSWLRGEGGQGSTWCQDSPIGSGGSWVGSTGSPGGDGGKATYGGQGNSRAGLNSSWGGGGGGGSDDNPPGPQQQGGRCHTSWNHPDGNRYAGAGAGGSAPGNMQDTVVNSSGFNGSIPTAHSGGGGGGVANTNGPGSDIFGTAGASGQVIWVFS